MNATNCTASEDLRSALEDALHSYLDGELDMAAQAPLFGHLAECQGCRSNMDSVLSFRRVAREEYIAVPQSADEAFFDRLAEVKVRTERMDRVGDREPLWQSRGSVSLGTTVVMAACLFILGLYLPRDSAEGTTSLIIGEQEMVDLEAPIFGVLNTVYVITPGVTVEGFRSADGP
ncbi:MAG: anti-sigma factor RsiW [Rhodothermales bacterium]|jgi:anti-sigma factor RsiW